MKQSVKSPLPPKASSERIKLQDLTCPLIRMDVARRRDKSWGFFLSVILHTVIFAIAGISLIKQPEFGVDRGVSGIDVDLVAASVEEKPQEIVVPPPEEVKSDFVEKIPEPIPVVKAVAAPVNTKGKDEVTAQSTGGAISEAKPDYLNNPAPPYPYEARKKGWEGTVILRVSVSKNGDATLVDVEQSSGHAVLDKEALKSVKKWKFRPAQIGNIPIESSVHVPIRFELQEN